MTSIDSMLAERGSRYGAFKTHAEHTQAIKRLLIKLMGRAKWDALADDQREALEMIAHKLGRITNGDPNYDDSWRDVAGYADLVAKRLANPAPEAKTEAEPETAAAPESQAKTDKTSECDCPACKIRRLLQSDEVTVILDAEVEDDEHSLRSFIQALEQGFKKS